MRLAPRPFGELPPAVRLTLAAVLCGYVLGLIAGPSSFAVFGIVPDKVFRDYWVWQLFTYLFVHANFLHVLVNMLMIWMLGSALEPIWGPKKFLKFFLYVGAAAGLANVLAAPHSAVPVVGASGAVYGLLAAFAVSFPESVIYLYFLFPVKAKYMALILGVLAFASSFNTASPVANFVHLSGLVFGYVYAKWGDRISAKILAPRASDAPDEPRETAVRQESIDIDALLEKISRRGIESLSTEEKRRMKEYSERMNSR